MAKTTNKRTNFMVTIVVERRGEAGSLNVNEMVCCSPSSRKKKNSVRSSRRKKNGTHRKQKKNFPESKFAASNAKNISPQVRSGVAHLTSCRRLQHTACKSHMLQAAAKDEHREQCHQIHVPRMRRHNHQRIEHDRFCTFDECRWHLNSCDSLGSRAGAGAGAGVGALLQNGREYHPRYAIYRDSRQQQLNHKLKRSRTCRIRSTNWQETVDDKVNIQVEQSAKVGRCASFAGDCTIQSITALDQEC